MDDDLDRQRCAVTQAQTAQRIEKVGQVSCVDP